MHYGNFFECTCILILPLGFSLFSSSFSSILSFSASCSSCISILSFFFSSTYHSDAFHCSLSSFTDSFFLSLYSKGYEPSFCASPSSFHSYQYFLCLLVCSRNFKVREVRTPYSPAGTKPILK